VQLSMRYQAEIIGIRNNTKRFNVDIYPTWESTRTFTELSLQ